MIVDYLTLKTKKPRSICQKYPKPVHSEKIEKAQQRPKI